MPPLSANAQGTTKNVTIKVVGIDRAGDQVDVVSNVTPLHGDSLPSTGPAYHVKPGTYYISGSVLTLPPSGRGVSSQTIIVRKVDVRRSGTIKLDARGGKLVSVWLNGKNVDTVTGESITAGVCVGLGGTSANLGDPIYVKPARIAGLSFVWAWHSPPIPGTHYDVTGLTKNGIPAHPVFRLRTSQLVKTVIQARSGTVAGTTGVLSSTSSLNPLCRAGGYEQTATLPFSVTVYRSPALWSTLVTTQVSTHLGLRQCTFDNLYTQEKARHRYTISIGDAARGPYAAVPFVQDSKLTYDSQYQFVAPAFQSYVTCFKSTVTLATGGHVVARRKGGDFRLLTAKVHPGRWYVLTTDARQVSPGVTPAGLLSPRTTLAWRFRLAKGAAGGVPVAVTSLLPQGLDLHNRAAPGSKTSVRAAFTQGKYALGPKPDVRVRSFTVQASFNDGKTWHGVAAVRHKGFWTFVVRNPSSGFVTLRTVTVNIHGNTSTETIYRAYGIR